MYTIHIKILEYSLNYFTSISKAPRMRNRSGIKFLIVIPRIEESPRITAVSFAIVFHGINDRCHRACLATTTYRQVVCDAAPCRDASRRGAVRSERVGFSSSSLSLLGPSCTLRRRPSPTLYHSSLTPSNLPRPPPRLFLSLSRRSAY